VKWKDGLTSDKIRKRDVLEEVFILKDTGMLPPTPIATEQPTATKPEPALKEEEPSSRNLDLDEPGLFDFDETLLL
jgi:hypothetical protein